ncbi:MAG: glycosyltransferase [Candidatus Binatia bacterium]
MSQASRRRLAFVSPLPPVRSGIADYASDLLPFVARDFAVEVFVDERHPLLRDGVYHALPVHPAGELRRRRAEFAHVVYQMGNNLHHRFVLELAQEVPGIAVLHDVVLHHLYEVIAGVEDAWEEYGRALRESYGRIGERVLSMKRWRLASERENFALPLFESVAAAGRGVIVHNGCAEREVRRRLPTVPVRRMPMGIPPGGTVDRRAARHRLGIDDRSVIVATFGFLIPTKRVDVLAAALARARRESPELRLVLIGEESPGTNLRELFSAEDLASGQVVHRGYVSAEEYRDWMAATDVAVNLRFPTAGETSASLLRLLGDGQCTLVSAYRQFLEIPPQAVVRIPLGREEEATLARELVALARDPGRRSRVGEAARAFVASEHSMEAAARGFREAVEAIGMHAPAPPPTPPLWRCPKTSRSAAIAGSAVPAGASEWVLRPGAPAEIVLRVRNEGDARWISTPEPFGGHVSLGADVVGAEGQLVARSRPVAPPRDVEPGDEIAVRLLVQAPDRPGAYRVQPILLHVGRAGRAALGAPLGLAVTPDG